MTAVRRRAHRDEFLTYGETSQRYGIPIGTLGRWVFERRIPHLRLGERTVRIPRAAFERWIDAHYIHAIERTP